MLMDNMLNLDRDEFCPLNKLCEWLGIEKSLNAPISKRLSDYNMK